MHKQKPNKNFNTFMPFMVNPILSTMKNLKNRKKG